MRWLTTTLVWIISFGLYAQMDTVNLDLKGVIDWAQRGAPSVQIAKTSFVNSYWINQSVLADFKPQINLDAQIPDLIRSIRPVTQPDGKDVFIPRAQMTNGFGVNLQQNLAVTGGTFFVRTGLERLDIFATGGNPSSQSFLATPLAVTYIQPLFDFNPLKWNKQLAPLEFQEAQRGYSEDMEDVAQDAARLFFDVLIAQLNLQAAQRDKVNADTLYAISKGRFDVGRIAETELLQIELNVMNADADLAENMLNLQTSTERLRDFLGIKEAVFFDLIPPNELPEFQISADSALSYALSHRSDMVSFELRQLEAQRDVENAERSAGVNIDLSLSFGLQNSAENLGDAYKDLLDNQVLSIGLNVPLADWGKAKSRIERARSFEELTTLQLEQDKINFEREVLINVQQFDLVRNQVRLADRAYEVARKRLNITRQRYRIGNILITDLNLAINEEASARAGYISTLRNFWLAYYELRRLTLFDFENDRPLIRGTREITNG